MVAEDDVARLLAAQHRAGAQHLLQHVPVADPALDHLDPRVPHGLTEPRVGHRGRDDGVPLQAAVLLQRDGARREDLVPVDHPPLRVGEQGTVGVTVVGDAGVRARLLHGGGHHLGVKRAAALVDVPPVRLVEHRPDVGAQPAKDIGGGPIRRAVGAVHDDPHPLEGCLGRRGHVRQVSLQAIGDLADPSPVAVSSCLPANLGLDLVLGLVGQLEAGRPEELDAVVLGWVV